MLCGQDFGGCHQARLASVVEGDEHTEQRHQRLAAAHVALQQSVHLLAATHVVAYLFDDPFLGIGELERKFLGIETVEVLTDGAKDQPVAFPLPFVFGILVVEMEEKQFLELHTLGGDGNLLVVAGEVYHPHGVVTRRQMVGGHDVGGQHLLDMPFEQTESVLHQPCQPFGGETSVLQFLGGVVDGDKG